MASNSERLLELLNGDDSDLDICQTHISIVYLTADFAYKRLKPVAFDFLDFSTREARYVHLANEARLNRRLAVGVYRRLVPLWRVGGRWKLAGDGPPREWLLEMERLSADANLEAFVCDGRVSERELARVVNALAAFFEKAPRSGEIAANGAASVLHQNLTENYRVIDSAAETGIVESSAAKRLRSAQLQSLIELDEEIQARGTHGWVRDGHGDLRCEHIYLTEPIKIVDCIAFNHRLRWIDTADDISFLATDLLRLGALNWARRLIERYRSVTADPISDRLLSFYRSYRFAVRAKVNFLRLQEALIEQQRRALISEARKYVELAIDELDWSRPWMIVVCGLSGTGKSSLARVLAEHLGATHLSSDAIRKELAGLAASDRGDATLYSAAMRRKTYEEMHSRAASMLQSGVGTVLDATYIDRSERDAARSVAEKAGLMPLFVECRCDEEEIVRRLRQREHKNDDASDATLEVWQSQRTITDGYAELPSLNHIVVDTSESADRLLDEIVSRLKGR